MKKIQYFKATKTTNRFNKNQKVWIVRNHSNYLHVFFKWRGNGRYVTGDCDKYANCVGEIKEIEVSEDFYNRIMNNDQR